MTSRTDVEVYNKDTHIQCLEETNKALAMKLAFLNARQMRRNDEQTTKWQNKAFYWKRKFEQLVNHLKAQGLERLVTLTPPQAEGDGNGKVRDTSSQT